MSGCVAWKLHTERGCLCVDQSELPIFRWLGSFYNSIRKGRITQRSSASIICYFFFTAAIQSVCVERFTARSFWINEASLLQSHVDMRGNDSLAKLYVWTERGRSSDSVITLIRTPSVPQHAIRACSHSGWGRDRLFSATERPSC